MSDRAFAGGFTEPRGEAARLAELEEENRELRRRLEETQDVVDAIRHHAVDAFVVRDDQGERVYALESADRPYRRFVDNMQEGALTLAPGGIVAYCNRRGAELLHRPHQSLIGQPITCCSFTDPGGLEALLAEGWQATARAELRIRRDDGSETPLQVTASPLDAGDTQQLCLIISDLTTQKLYERLLQSEDERGRSEARFRALAETLPQFVWETDAVGRPLFTNRRWHSFTGVSGIDLDSEAWSTVLHPNDAPRIADAWSKALAEGTEYEALCRFRRASDGAYRWFQVKAAPVRDDAGTIARWVGACVDVEDQVNAMTALEEADRQKNQFLAMLAHELRNPLAPIRNAVELMRLIGPKEPALEGARDMIARQVQHLVRLVDDLLDVARISQGKIRLQRDTVNLATVIAHAVETSRPLIDAGRHQLAVALPQRDAVVHGDFARLVQVTANLLNNAAKYTDHGGRIDLVLEIDAAAREAILCVRDNGRGLDPDRLDDVFEPFFQIEQGLDRAQGGLGIGLSVVKSLVAMHGGSIEARSEGQGKGSEFCVRLPLSKAAAESPASTASGPKVTERPLRILVVDDNRDAADSLAVLLRVGGHRVRTVYDGKAAVEASMQDSPDVVLLDLGLPLLDGYSACSALREKGLQRTLIVAMTGYGQDEDRRRSNEAGFDAHLVKPVEPTILKLLLAERFGS